MPQDNAPRLVAELTTPHIRAAEASQSVIGKPDKRLALECRNRRWPYDLEITIEFQCPAELQKLSAFSLETPKMVKGANCCLVIMTLRA